MITDGLSPVNKISSIHEINAEHQRSTSDTCVFATAGFDVVYDGAAFGILLYVTCSRVGMNANGKRST